MQGCGRGRGKQGNKFGCGAGSRTGVAFKGHTSELDGHIFQVFHKSNNRNQFARTMAALGEYFVKNMKYAGDIMPLARDLTNPEVLQPTPIDKTETDWNIVFTWEKEMMDYITQKNVLQSDLKAAYTIMWGQCSKALCAKVKSSTNYSTKSADCDCQWLIKTMCGVMLCFDGQCKIHRSISDAHGAYHAY